MKTVTYFSLLFVLATFFVGCSNKPSGSQTAEAADSSSIGSQMPEQFGWRGPHRDGIYNETGLLKKWPANGPELLWEASDLGKGFSSPVIVGDRLYITGDSQDETKEVFMAYSLDGKQLYAKEYGNLWTKANDPDVRTTPTIVGDKAYVISENGEIVCLNTADGSIVWKVEGSTFGNEAERWGNGESPLVYDGKVIYTAGGKKTTVVALDAATGKTVWQSPSIKQKSAYVSPILINYKGKKQVVAYTDISIVGLDAETGSLEWQTSDWGKNPFGEGNTASDSPIFKDGYLLSTGGEEAGLTMFKLGDDMKSISKVWTDSTLKVDMTGFVLIDGVIYTSIAIDRAKTEWCAIDWATGKKLYGEAWKGGKGNGAIISADGMLYIYDQRHGYIGLANVNKTKFDVVSEFRITKGEGAYYAHPVINNGVLYVRHGSYLAAYKIK